MENLRIKNTNNAITKNLLRVGDIVYFEGPLLALFEDLSNGLLYVFDWVDRDEKSNRWLVYKVMPQSLLDFVQSKISHFDLFFKNINAEIYVVDIENQHKISDYKLLELEEIPLKYYPNKDNFFDVSDCPSVDKILAVVQKMLSRAKQENK